MVVVPSRGTPGISRVSGYPVGGGPGGHGARVVKLAHVTADRDRSRTDEYKTIKQKKAPNLSFSPNLSLKSGEWLWHQKELIKPSHVPGHLNGMRLLWVFALSYPRGSRAPLDIHRRVHRPAYLCSLEHTGAQMLWRSRQWQTWQWRGLK